MKIKAVPLMREVREKIAYETTGMSWEQEREYLRKHSGIFRSFVEQLPNNGATSDHGIVGAPAPTSQPVAECAER